jgi:hypothetical protein
VSVVCCLCDGLIYRPEDSYRLWRVVCVCDLENLVNEEAIARVRLQRHVKKKTFSEIVPFIKKCGIYRTAGQATRDNMAHANCMLYT